MVKRMLNLLFQGIVFLALKLGVREMNTACVAWIHQPEIPDGMEELVSEIFQNK